MTTNMTAIRKIFFIVTLIASTNSFSQSYIEMYRNGLTGLVYLDQGQLDSAEKYLLKALAVAPDKTTFSGYFSLVKIADKHKDTRKMAEYLRALSCIFPKDTIYTYLKEYEDVSLDAATFNSLYHPKCRLTAIKDFTTPHPKALDSIIASMRDKDQGIRKKVSRNKGPRTEEEIAALQKEMHDIDSANFIVLYDCIKKYGMPRIDGDDHLGWSRSTLIIHIDNYTNFKKIGPYLLKALKQGLFSPADYAYSMDRSLVASGLTPKYYWFIPETSFAEKYKPDQKEIAKINNDRRKIGLPPYPMWTGMGF